MNFEYLLKQLKANIFLPKDDSPTKLPDEAGAYVICAKCIEDLPIKMKELEFLCINGLPVIYVGIAGRPTSKVKSLRKRDYKNHFNGKARTSTLRKSIGVLFDLEKRYLYKENKSKYSFIPEHEEKLSLWMKDNLVMHYISIENPMEFEKYLINFFEPPLNLKSNNSEHNKDFRKELYNFRNYTQIK